MITPTSTDYKGRISGFGGLSHTNSAQFIDLASGSKPRSGRRRRRHDAGVL
jgi:hypothetical protein